MSWQNILGHDSVAEKICRAYSKGRLSGSFLFIGPAGIGKRSFAFALAKSLLCKTVQESEKNLKKDPQQLQACGTCESCILFPKHPDFFFISKPEDKTFIPLELLIGSKENRGKEGLCFEISRTPFMGKRKIAIIDDADDFNAEGANALLKTLEEPPPDSLLILLGTSATKQLPTIRSRCQIFRFTSLSQRHLATILLEQNIVASLEQGLKIANRAKHAGSCSVTQSLDLLDESLESFQTQLFQILDGKQRASTQLAIMLNEFIESAGKEAQVRRKKLRTIFNSVLTHERSLLEKTSLAQQEKVRFLFHRLEKTLDALEQVDRNANIPLIIDHWANGLS